MQVVGAHVTVNGHDPTHQPGLAADVERLARRVATDTTRINALAELLTQLATDVATLAARSAPDGDDAVRAWLLTEVPEIAVRDLEDLAGWLTRVYLRYPDAALPACWAWHPAAVEELRWLRATHAEAYHEDRGSWAKAADWHDRLRPGATQRLNTAYGACELREHAEGGTRHRPAPTIALPGSEALIAQAWATTPDTPLIPTEQQITDAERHDQQEHHQSHYPQHH